MYATVSLQAPAPTATPSRTTSGLSGSIYTWLILMAYLTAVRLTVAAFFPNAFNISSQAALFGLPALGLWTVLGLVVLPEVAAFVTPQSRKQWLAVISSWAKEANAPVVAGLFDEDLRKNQLVITDETGQIVAAHETQYPATMFGEPRSETQMPPALLERDSFPISAVTCVDLDYSDLVRPVARVGGVLAVPAHDWEKIFEMHHRCAVWAAVTAGVPVVCSAGDGMSAVYDAAGRVVARASSVDGPVALVADVPIACPAAKASRDQSLLADDIQKAPHEAIAVGAQTGPSKEVR